MTDKVCPIRVLASDLDGTLLPLPDDPHNARDLVLLQEKVAAYALTLVFVTGRPLWSIEAEMAAARLPRPDWLIANVGTEIYHRDNRQEAAYAAELDRIAAPVVFEQAASHWDASPLLERQEDAKQGRHKLSYYCRPDDLEQVAELIRRWLAESEIPLSLVASRDPFAEQGLIDLLPRGVDKNYALLWWCRWRSYSADEVIYAGDSGNDLAAMQSGFATIVVGNAAAELKTAVERYHRDTFGSASRLYVADRQATSGVLDGVSHFVEKS